MYGIMKRLEARNSGSFREIKVFAFGERSKRQEF